MENLVAKNNNYRQISVYIEKTVYAQLSKKCDETGISKRHIITQAIKKYLDEFK